MADEPHRPTIDEAVAARSHERAREMVVHFGALMERAVKTPENGQLVMSAEVFAAMEYLGVLICTYNRETSVKLMTDVLMALGHRVLCRDCAAVAQLQLAAEIERRGLARKDLAECFGVDIR